MELRVSTPDELIAAVPHLIGFRVEESMVVVPVSIGQGLPLARVDLPSNAEERTEMVESLLDAYRRTGGGDVLLIGFADHPSQIAPVARQLRESLAEAGVRVGSVLWAGEQRWSDLDTCQGGPRTTEVAGRIDAEMVVGGRRMPAASREAVERAFTGDPEPVARYLPGVADAMDNSTPARERQWAIGRAETFVQEGRGLTDPEAARMLACLQSVSVRDQFADRISRESAPSWAPLWDDLTSRSPDEFVAPTATLAALTSWCEGNGARAWCALDRIPVDQRQSYRLASLVASALQGGVHPREWDQRGSAVLEVPPSDDRERPGALGALGARSEPPTMGEGLPPVGPAR